MKQTQHSTPTFQAHAARSRRSASLRMFFVLICSAIGVLLAQPGPVLAQASTPGGSASSSSVPTGNGGDNPMISSPRIQSRSVPDLQPLSAEQALGMPELGDYAWTPDGQSLVIVSDLGGQPNLWRLNVSAPAWPHPITFVDFPIRAPRVSPDGRYVLFIGNLPGDARGDLFVVPIGGGSPQNLTASREVDERDAEWSPGGHQIAYSSDHEVRGTYQIYVQDVVFGQAGATPRRVSRSVQSSLRPQWRPDGRSLVVSRYRTPVDANLVLLQLVSGDEVVLTPHRGEQEWRVVALSPRGERILATANANGQRHVAQVEVETRKVTWVTQGASEGLAQDWSRAGDQIAWCVNQAGNFYLHSASAKDSPRGGALHIRRGQIEQARYSPDGTLLAFKFSNAQRAPDLWVYDFARSTARQVTLAMNPQISSSGLVEPYLVRYAAQDGTEITAFLYVPPNLKDQERRPALVWVHDGPWLQHQNGFQPMLQLLVRRGYVVIAPNYRGSEGFGQSFETLDNQDWGGGDVHDLVAASRYLRVTPYVDEARIGIVGWGFGGYLALQALTRSPETWAAGVAAPGLFDLKGMLERSPSLIQARMLYELGRPEEKGAFWQDRSPVNFLENLRAPLLIVDGALEHQFQPGDNGAAVAAIRARGGVVKHVVLSRQTTGLAGMRSQLEVFQALEAFLVTYLASEAAAPSQEPVPELASDPGVRSGAGPTVPP